MTGNTRWSVAQGYEKGYWENAASDLREGRSAYVDFYQWRGTRLIDALRKIGREDLVTGDARILEVGGGPVGLSGFLPAAQRLAVDPLEDFYRSDEGFLSARPSGVEYVRGIGEDLPAEDGVFDLVIIENCIDHVQDMHSVMSELRRVLRPGGVLYLTVNARSRIGYVTHRVISKLRLDPGHPHTLTVKRAGRLVEKSGFDLLHLEHGRWLPEWKADLTSRGLRGKAKALLGVSEFVVTIFGEKT